MSPQWTVPKIEEIGLPAPLINANVDLRDRRYMPQMLERLRNSEFRGLATLEEIGGAQLLWEAAWRQVPAGSLPNDDDFIGKILGFSKIRTKFGKVSKSFDKNWNHFIETKRMFLWGFILCSDGKFYHRVICEEAQKSWELKQKQRDRTFAATQARIGIRQRHDDVTRMARPTSREGNDQRNVHQDKIREEKIREVRDSDSCSNRVRTNEKSSTDFDKFYGVFPRKANRQAAVRKFEAAVKSGIEPTKIVAAAMRYAEACRLSRTEKQFVKMPDTWLSKGCYDDGDLPISPIATSASNRPSMREHIRRADQEAAEACQRLLDIEHERDTNDA